MLFSIVTINRNNALGLERTMNSVLGQKNCTYEYIIIDGASSDNSLDIIEKNSSKIKKYISEPDSGIYNAMNKSLEYVSGDYVVFMNSGDEFASLTVLSEIEKMNLVTDFIFGGFIGIKDGVKNSTQIPKKQISLYYLLYGNICHQATFVKPELLRNYGGYNENIGISADWAFLFDSLVLGNRTYSVISLYICKYDLTGISAGKLSASRIKKEKLQHFKSRLPMAFDDYMFIHSIRRLSPKNIYKYIKWKMENH